MYSICDIKPKEVISVENNTNPLISIIIPVYNGSNYLEEAIESALNQTYKNIEVIVVNDGSTDNGATEAIALKYRDRIRYFHKPNGGVSSALNLGIQNMRGDYFSWLSHDDKYYPSKIEDQVQILRSLDNKKCLILSKTVQIDKNSNIIPKRKPDMFYRNEFYLSSQQTLKAILQHGAFSGCALLIPRQAFEQAGLFDERLRYTQDVMMWYKIFIAGYGLYVANKVGVMSRVHGAQLTQTGRAIFKENCKLMAEELIPVFLNISTREHHFLYYYALNNAKYNNQSIVAKCLSYKRFSLNQTLSVRFMQLYGRIRPFIRRVYHFVFNKIKTQ